MVLRETVLLQSNKHKRQFSVRFFSIFGINANIYRRLTVTDTPKGISVFLLFAFLVSDLGQKLLRENSNLT